MVSHGRARLCRQCAAGNPLALLVTTRSPDPTERVPPCGNAEIKKRGDYEIRNSLTPVD